LIETGEFPAFVSFLRVTEHVVEEGGDEVGGAAVGLGAQSPQLLRRVQDANDSLLLWHCREGNLQSLDVATIDRRKGAANSLPGNIDLKSAEEMTQVPIRD
jgi:hypothetical protein